MGVVPDKLGNGQSRTNRNAAGTVFVWLWLWLVGVAWAQPNFAPRWRWSNPLPHGGNIYDMAYGFGLTVQVAERGQIFTSEDLVYWEPRASGTTNSLLAVTFLGNRLIAAGENGTVVYADSLFDFRVVNLGTPDWLLGAAASANVAVLVGDNAAIYTSPDGATWIRQSPPAQFNQWLRSVAYGKNGFVAVGENGSILSSANGNNWKKETSGTTNHLNRVVYFNDQFWIVGERGTVLTQSGNGWTNVPGVNTTNELYAAVGTTNELLVAGAGEARLRRGNVWTSQLDPPLAHPAPKWTYYAGLFEEPVLLLAGRSGVVVEGVNTNGDYTWILRYDSPRTWLWDLAATPDLYVAVGDRATILSSLDGVTWNLEMPPDGATNSVLLGVAGTTNLLVAVGNKGTLLISPAASTNLVLTNELNGVTVLTTNEASTLGVIWRDLPRPTTNDLQAVAHWSNRWVIAGGNGKIFASSDGTNWQAQTTPTAAFLSGAAGFPGGFVVTGDKGVILTSPDGQAWQLQTSGTTNWIYKARYLNGQCVAVGEKGTVLVSPDGLNWSERNSGTTVWLKDIAYVGGVYYAVGSLGTVIASSNTLDWINVGAITTKSLFGAAARNNQLIMAGVEGVIIRSQIVPDLTPVRIQRFAATPPTNTVARKLFLISGKPDQRFQLENSFNLVTWTNGPPLELLDASGTLLFLDESPVYWKEFFRARLIP